MSNPYQISLMDFMLFSKRSKTAKISITLHEMDKLINWSALEAIVKKLDRSNTSRGGRKPIALITKLKMLFVQHLYNLSDPELEDQLIDRLSFQHFVGIGLNQEIPDFSTLWRFKEALIKEKLMDRVFSSIVSQIELKGLLIKRGTLADATIIESNMPPLSKEERKELEANPSSQKDIDASSTEKNNKKYFGYKGHIGLDEKSKIIRKRVFTTAKIHDSQKLEDVMSGDERMICADKAYANKKLKSAAKEMNIFYAILEKGARGKKLTALQEHQNKRLSRIRAAVEHPFAFMKNKLKYTAARAKNLERNALAFDMNCIIYNVLRASFLLKHQL